MRTAQINGMDSVPAEILFSGARIYNPDSTTKEAWIELPLSLYFQAQPEDGWKLAGVALIEARRLGYTSAEMGHPSSLIGEVRRWFRNNADLQNVVGNDQQAVWLIIRPGCEQLMRRWDDEENGICEYVPIPRWSIKVTPK